MPDDQSPIAIAAMLAVRNRAETTVTCLRTLTKQLDAYPGSSIVVVDDGSTDDTAARIAAEFPSVQVLTADGDQFWGGAMRMAESVTRKLAVTHVLWVNDDADLAADAIDLLVQVARSSGADRTLVTGAMSWPGEQRTSYSGAVRRTKLGFMELEQVDPGAAAVPVDATNGNLVLIPRQALVELGGIDETFSHKYGDFDFSMRARKAGYVLLLAPGFLGETPRNGSGGTHLDVRVGRRERLRRLRSKKGIPFKQKSVYLRRHGSIIWPVQLVLVHAYHVARALTIRVRRPD